MYEHKPQWIREDRLPTLEEVAWLTGDEGREVGRRMATAEPADTPAAIARWRERLPPERVSAAWSQVLLRAAGRAKFTRAEEMIFDRVGLEQSTSEAVAAYKAGRFAGMKRVADLCCGIGGDALALAASSEVVALDWAAVRAVMARHNASVYGRQITPVTGDAAFDRPEADAVHIDPDRRPGGKRRHEPDSGSPGLRTLERIVSHYRHAAIKLSPGADFDALPFDCEIELISHRGECKQAVAWTGDLRAYPGSSLVAPVLNRWSSVAQTGVPQTGVAQTGVAPASTPCSGLATRSPSPSRRCDPSSSGNLARGVFRRATVLPAGHTLTAETGESLDWPTPQPPAPGSFLHEPDPAVIRANLVGVLARQLDLAPIDAHIAWLTGPQFVHHPMTHTFRIIDVRPWSAKPARAWLAGHDIGTLDVKTRGFAASPEAILRQLRPTGRRPAVLFLTRIADKPTAILTERHPPKARA